MDPELLAYKEDFERLHLDENAVAQLHATFKKIDADSSNQLDLKELMGYLEVPATTFMHRVFHIFDEDGNGTVDFKEFVTSLYNYCTLGKPGLVMFSFDLYDADNSGAIEVGEMQVMLHDVYGEAHATNKLAAKIKDKIMHLNTEEEGKINLREFSGFIKQHPGLLYPAFNMQVTLIRKLLGERFWKVQAEQRMVTESGA